jgi:hypothetical protein
MIVTTSPLNVLHRGPYSTAQDRDPLKWGAGQGAHEGEFIEKIMCLDPATNVVLDNFTLSPELNGDIHQGDVLCLTCEVNAEMVIGANRRATVKYKWRVIGAVPAPVVKPSSGS